MIFDNLAINIFMNVNYGQVIISSHSPIYGVDFLKMTKKGGYNMSHEEGLLTKRRIIQMKIHGFCIDFHLSASFSFFAKIDILQKSAMPRSWIARYYFAIA